MSFVSKTYELGKKINDIVHKKSFNTVLIAVLGVVMFFGVMNIYAADTIFEDQNLLDTKISPDWKGMKAFQNVANGTDKEEDNMSSHAGVTSLNTAYTVLSYMAPSITMGGDKIKNDPDIPADMKLGLIGFADNSYTLAYNIYPTANIGEHLAKEWVPGYKDGNTSLYAASQNGYDYLKGTGLDSLWTKTRDIAYLAFVVIMIVVGFMIMFRSKIGGQTLVTIGNLIPNVIVSLILVTFSFAIAGLIIDLGGVLVSVINGIYDGKGIAIDNIWTMIASGFSSEVLTSSAGLSGIVALAGGIAAATVMSLGSAAVIAGILLVLVMLVIVGIVLVGAIKVVIAMFKSILSLYLSVVTGPIQIMIGTFPGQNHMIVNWFLTILRSVLVFPLIFAIVNLPDFLFRNAEMNFSFPGKLVNSEDGSWAMGLMGTDPSFAKMVMFFVLKVAVLYFAAEAPKYLEAWFPPNTPKAVAEGLGNARANMSKIPLVGGLFR